MHVQLGLTMFAIYFRHFELLGSTRWDQMVLNSWSEVLENTKHRSQKDPQEQGVSGVCAW